MTQPRQQSKIDADLRKLFRSPLGKKVLYDLMLANSVFTTTLYGRDQSERDAMEGRRALILEILEKTRGPINPEEFMAASEAAAKSQMAANAAHDPLDTI